MLKVFTVILGIVCLFLVYVQLTYHQKFDVAMPAIHASADSSMIARGRYLVLGPSHCYACHTNDSLRALKRKEPLMGGNVYKTPFGDFNMPNITSDPETGIGALSDEEIARAIRYNVNHKGEAMVGFMAFNNFSDEDLTAIVSYLRTTEPITHKVPSHDLNMIGKILMRFLIKPKLDGIPSQLTPDSSIAYGEYMAYTVAQCNSCHTKRDKMGKFIGEPFAGGFVWEYDDGTYTSPNLTPDHATGRLAGWTQDNFINRFRMGSVLEHSPMPWEAYQNMTESDLKALFKYLQSLPPVENAVVEYRPN